MSAAALRRTRRFAVFGGSFDPPHLGHEAIIRTLLDIDAADEVWVVPVFEHPFGKRLAPFAERLEMCRLAFAHLGERVRLLDIEREMGGPSYTVRTLERLRADSPGDQLLLVVGADALRDTAHWRDFDRVRELSRLLVVPRAGEARGADPAVLDVPAPPDISSSEIRRRLAAGEGAAGMLRREVELHAGARGLYRAAATDSNGRTYREEGP